MTSNDSSGPDQCWSQFDHRSVVADGNSPATLTLVHCSPVSSVIWSHFLISNDTPAIMISTTLIINWSTNIYSSVMSSINTDCSKWCCNNYNNRNIPAFYSVHLTSFKLDYLIGGALPCPVWAMWMMLHFYCSPFLIPSNKLTVFWPAQLAAALPRSAHCPISWSEILPAGVPTQHILSHSRATSILIMCFT